LATDGSNTRGTERSSALAAGLSFLWPGLGQFYLGLKRSSAAFSVPALLIGLYLLLQLQRGILYLGARLLTDRNYALPVVLVLMLAGALRLAAVVHAFERGRIAPNRRVLEWSVLGVLVFAIVGTHVAAGYAVWYVNDSLQPAFKGGNPDLIDQATPPPSLAPGATPTAAPTVTPVPTPVPITSRVTILFTGVDADPARKEHLYDSIMVVSYDPKTNSLQMVSVPRDSASYPLYFGGQVSARVRINSLPTYARNGWVLSPDPPYTTLVKEIQYLVGIPINYYAVMDLNGFVQMIDMLGGIDINNPSAINDPVYATPAGDIIGFKLAAGPQHLDGNAALAYVRSRHGTGNNDWKREGRQQQVVVALLHKMAEPGSLLQLPGLISKLGSSVGTDFPEDRVADYVNIGLGIPAENISQVVLGPPDYTIIPRTDSGPADTTCLLNDKVAQLSVQLFGADSLWYGKKPPANTCPA
jgi:LCP family protein required for cell wall assembly